MAAVSDTSDAAEARATTDGRAPWHMTNAPYQLRTIVEYRQTQTGRSGEMTSTIGELVYECGHVVQVLLPGGWWNGVVERAKKIRCQSCPIEVRPVPDNQCTYHEETGPRLHHCTAPAHWHTDEWGGPEGANLCTTHYRHLRREGDIAHPAQALD